MEKIGRMFEEVNEELERENRGNIEVSGSTALLVQIHDNIIYCANSGDCRAVLGKKKTAVELSTQHKPDKPK